VQGRCCERLPAFLTDFEALSESLIDQKAFDWTLVKNRKSPISTLVV
jgi:hypothetical protein